MPVHNLNLNDEQPNLRMEAASTLSTLTEAASPFGIEFDTTPHPGARRQRVKAFVSPSRPSATLIHSSTKRNQTTKSAKS